MIWEMMIILSVQNELYLNSITNSMPDLEFKFHLEKLLLLMRV